MDAGSGGIPSEEWRRRPAYLELVLVCEALRSERAAHSESLPAMAKKLGVSKGFLSELERAKKVPPWRIVQSYDEYFKCDGVLIGLLEDYQAARREASAQSPDAPRSERYPLPGDVASFVRDLTPDGMQLSPGESTVKSWRIRNAGVHPWHGRLLRRTGRLAGVGVPTSARDTPIPHTPPGEMVDLSVEFFGAELAGTRMVRFKMVDAAGFLCFPGDVHGLLTDVVSLGPPQQHS